VLQHPELFFLSAYFDRSMHGNLDIDRCLYIADNLGLEPILRYFDSFFFPAFAQHLRGLTLEAHITLYNPVDPFLIPAPYNINCLLTRPPSVK
jgi:hypothetical protein